jgi:hypothetical protein
VLVGREEKGVRREVGEELWGRLGGRGELFTVWPSLERSMEGWFGGRTSFVVPITGHDILAVI